MQNIKTGDVNEPCIISRSITAVISFITIFLFKKRQLQCVVGRIVILINLFLLGLLIYLSLTLPGETSFSEKGIGMFLPILVSKKKTTLMARDVEIWTESFVVAFLLDV